MSAAQQPLRVQMIGGPGVGKSSFIGALALLAEKPRGGYFVTPIDGETKRRFDDLRTSFRALQWPAKTATGQSVRCRIHRGGSTVIMELEDFAGEAFLAAMQRGDDDEASRRIESLVHQADLLLIMIDAAELESGAGVAALPLIQAVTQRLSRDEAGAEVPVAVLLTKADLCKQAPVRTPGQAQQRVAACAADVAEFLRTQVERLSWFPLSVCGYGDNRETTSVACDFQPAGFERLFELFFTLRDQPAIRRRKQMIAFAILVMMFAVAVYHYRSGEVARERVRIEDPVARVQDLPANVAAANESAYRERVLQELLRASEDLRGARSPREVEEIIASIDGLPGAVERLVGEELAALRKQGHQRTEQLLHARMLDAAAAKDSDSLRQAVDQYLKHFPDGPGAEKARGLLAGEEEKRRARAREEIRSNVVWDAASLQRKLQRIADYVAQWDRMIPPSERAEIQQASAAARRMLQPNAYRVTLVRTAGLDRARAHGVQVAVAGREVARFDDSATVSEKIWNRDFTLQWQLGMKIDVTLLNFRFRNSDIAYLEGRGPMAILMLAETNSATRYGPSFASSRPPVSVKFRCEQLDDQTVAAIESWIYPGTAW